MRRDLQRLLNTRTRPGDGTAGTTLNYGLPDFAHVSPSDIAAYETLALSIGRVIEAFEPRIQHVRVTLKFDPADPRVLVGSIEGKIRMSLIAEPVSFPLEISAGSGGAMVGKSSAMAQGA